jgi:hypothetical protein
MAWVPFSRGRAQMDGAVAARCCTVPAQQGDPYLMGPIFTDPIAHRDVKPLVLIRAGSDLSPGL